MGVPLITAIYKHDPRVGLYTLPLLILLPLQLLVGSFLAPRLHQFVDRECERLGLTEDDKATEPMPISAPASVPQTDFDEELGIHENDDGSTTSVAA